MSDKDIVKCKHCTRAYTSCPYYNEENDSCKGLTLKKKEKKRNEYNRKN